MRFALPYLLAAVLGVGCAALAACGSGSSDRSALIPARSAARMKSALSDVRSAVADHDCEAAARARGVLVNLPSSVDSSLVARLRDGIDNLQQIAPQKCQQQNTTPTQTTPETTPTQTTPTQTTPTNTTPTDTTPTSTTPTTTTTTPTQTTTTTAPTTSTAAPPPADTTGGTGTG